MIPWATSVRMMPIWAKPRAAPPPSASPITGRRMLPRPTLSWASEPFWPRPIQLPNTQTLLRLQRYSPRRGRARRVLSDPLAWFMPAESGLGRECDWTTTGSINIGCRCGFRYRYRSNFRSGALRRLEFAAFSVKSMAMISNGNGIVGFGRGRWPFLALALALAVAALLPVPVAAQMFSDRPPPVPPAAVPDVQTGPAMNLAPPSGTGTIPPPLTQPTIVPPSIATIPPAAPPAAPVPSQGVLSLTARYGKDLPVINGGLVWRVFADKPDDTGTFKL